MSERSKLVPKIEKSTRSRAHRTFIYPSVFFFYFSLPPPLHGNPFFLPTQRDYARARTFETTCRNFKLAGFCCPYTFFPALIFLFFLPDVFLGFISFLRFSPALFLFLFVFLIYTVAALSFLTKWMTKHNNSTNFIALSLF